MIVYVIEKGDLWRMFLSICLIKKANNEYMKSCNEAISYYKQFPQFDVTEVLTKVFFSLVVDNKEYIQNELEQSIPKTGSFKKIYKYIEGG